MTAPAERGGAYWAGATAAFAAELASLAALGWAGATASVPGPARVTLGAGLPLVAVLLWGLFAAPRAPRRGSLTTPVTVVLVEGGAVAALALRGHPLLAGVLAACVIAGRLLTAPAGTGSRPG
jgi:hypothetical protein